MSWTVQPGQTECACVPAMDASGEATLKPGKPGFSIGPLIGSGAPPQPAHNRPA